MYLNEVTLCGNLGGNPEIRTTQNGTACATFNFATSESWKDKNTGEKRERTQWHRIVIWADGLVKMAEKYLAKGDNIWLRGQLETRKWQAQDGTDRFVTEVVLKPYKSEIRFVHVKSFQKNGNGNGGGGGHDDPGPKEQAPGFGSQPRRPPIENDEIPF
jgi:single-strand DNA-binding protein